MDADCIVIGGGAAGLMCAGEAGKRGRTVLILEHAARIGKKILISGGGRCNFTNINTAPENFISENPNFCKSALARFTAHDFIELVQSHGIKYHEKKLGQLFCDGSSREIVLMLETECRQAGVEIRTNCAVHRISKIEATSTMTNSTNQFSRLPDASLSSVARFQVETNQGTLTCASLVIATGGVSIPKMGATDFGYRIARQFGLRVTQIKPALVPLTWDADEAHRWQELSGIAFNASVSCGAAEFDESVLLTHRGLSGPAVLQISSYWNPAQKINVRLLPFADTEEILHRHQHETAELATVLGSYLPSRFAKAWCATHDFPSRPMNRFSAKELSRIAAQLASWELTPRGTEGFAKAEVTLGGVNTRELSSRTMEALRVPGLYFIGEVVDVTGQLGGYNFQWAWSSGYAAGQNI
ncbi:MAG: NAD(P)/FAD-dependent oxidoreductase [Pyrinomonadaceae bacterium MAG19_C2-C3]|nr:NAD(P)/FAD-dependent oxidoreductase [Pyrinomonadaceae bacterium MAG19_C2-C3]